ncbi:MAG TPA: hypothetical protein VNI57_09265, partial [Candidatus Saccharimonadales bacterium]|nr:hypothetical protein [Candidatus Saccharimonadales bacterium]
GSPTVENDLEEAAIRLRPSLKELRHVLEASGARSVAMTGSGSTFFGIYESEGAARAGLRRVREAGYPAVAARGISRAERERSLWMEADGGVSQG